MIVSHTTQLSVHTARSCHFFILQGCFPHCHLPHLVCETDNNSERHLKVVSKNFIIKETKQNHEILKIVSFSLFTMSCRIHNSNIVHKLSKISIKDIPQNICQTLCGYSLSYFQSYQPLCIYI